MRTVKHRPLQTHQIFMIASTMPGKCAACDQVAMLEFRDGDNNMLICRKCYELVALGNVILKEIERKPTA